MIHIRHRITNEILKSLRDADLSYSDLRDADLTGANLTGADLSYSDLRDANLTGADLRGAYLRGANLEGVNLEGANLTGADLRGAYLRGANLKGANLEGADLRGAYLRGANLKGADLTGVIGNCKEIKSIQTNKYKVNFTATHLTIGCKSYTLNQWQLFSDAQISNMDTGALKWWKDWKEIIFKMIELSEKDK